MLPCKCTNLVSRGQRPYRGGQFTDAGGVPANYIARWNGSNWDTLGSGFAGGSGNSEPHVLMEYNAHLYAGGDFNMAGSSPVSNVAQWNGTVWSDVGGGTSGGQSHELFF